jgi:hypothetical protein
VDSGEPDRFVEPVPDPPDEKEAEGGVLVLDPDELFERAEDHEIQIADRGARRRSIISDIDRPNLREGPGAGECRDRIAADGFDNRPDERSVSRLILPASHQPVPVSAKPRAVDPAVRKEPRVGHGPDTDAGAGRWNVGGNLVREVRGGRDGLDPRRAGRGPERERSQEKAEASAVSFAHSSEDA